MEADITIASVRTFDTRGGNKRYVVRDSGGNEYTTFREHIGSRALEYQGQPAHIEYHEEQRGDYRNVYLDKVESIPQGSSASEGPDTEPEEAAWRTAVDAAPWLVGESEPHAKTPPEELYRTLKPFKDKVADDIKERDPGARTRPLEVGRENDG